MSTADHYKDNSSTVGMWASVSLNDGLVFEGTVQGEKPYGLYISIGGDPSRLSFFPWGVVTRVVYKLA